MPLPVTPPVKPMLAKAAPELPAGDIVFEPKWDGFRCIVFRDGDEITLGSRNERPLTRYFPEIIEPLKQSLPDRAVVDGELVVTESDRLAFDALQQRIHPAESRVAKLAAETPSAFVAFDLLALDESDLRSTPFAQRRAVLEGLAGGFIAPVHLTPVTRDRELAMRWFRDFEGAGLDGLIAKPADGLYVENKRTQFKLKHVRSADAVVAGFRIHKDGEGVGSLLLGLYDDGGVLHHVGVATSFTRARRQELLEELAEYRLDDISSHPWASWLEAEAHESGRMPGAPHRWSNAAGKDHRWIPIRPELVCEVKYESMLNGRFRATTRWLRWRHDRDPASCGYDQIETPADYSFADVLASSTHQ
jgi:ATP-dependent DNA ligase